MPLAFKPIPADIADVIKTGLEQMVSMQAFSTPRLAQIVSGQPEVSPDLFQALPVYHMGLAELAEDGDLGAAAQTSWRYLLKYDDEVVASADAVFGPNRKPVFSQVNEGTLLQGTVSAIQAADVEKDIKKGEYEVRLLMVPALYTAALWLVDVAGDRDLALPIAPCPPALTPDKPIPVEKLLAVLRDAAKAALAAQPPGEPIGGGGNQTKAE
jgi:hypothetical protein